MTLPRSTPRDQGVDAAGLLAFLDAAEREELGLHGLVVARHGHVVAEAHWAPYAADRVHLAYSLSKTLTATAVGVLVGDRVLGLDDLVLERLPRQPAGSVAPGWERVRVRHCLSMTVGHDVDAWDRVGSRGAASPVGEDWLPRVLAVALDHEPGTTFTYDQVATYLLARVVHHVTGRGLSELLADRVLGPLGLPTPPWHRDPLGHEIGFSGAHLTTGTIASLAQLLLDGGVRDGVRLLDAAYVEEALRPVGPRNREESAGPDWRRGYGFSFWAQRHGCRGDGAFGQFLVVLPEQDAVVAITSENDVMQATLDALWAHVVPALGGPGASSDGSSDRALAARLAAVEVPPLRAGAGATLPEGDVVVQRRGGDVAPAYDEVRVDADGTRLALRRDGEWHEVAVSDGTWASSTWTGDRARLPLVASGGWVDEHVHRTRVLVVETPHSFSVEVDRRTGSADLAWRRLPLSGADPWALAVRPA
ncbi:serine hydrolase domain-containing protein [Nocardioides scoriae]|uniref:serine hydrolase domain-containing protein n=1 Tax=Nocardioides scoriae TaxID=642780 RepID=UPI0012F8DFCC|nr:serine hydrolase domain-containing protein [Nocardioides scoriae]